MGSATSVSDSGAFTSEGQQDAEAVAALASELESKLETGPILA